MKVSQRKSNKPENESRIKYYLIIEEVEQVFDGERKRRAAMCRAEDGLEQIVDKLLKRALRCEQSCQVNLGDHFVVALAILVVVPFVPDEVPDLEPVEVDVVLDVLERTPETGNGLR